MVLLIQVPDLQLARIAFLHEQENVYQSSRDQLLRYAGKVHVSGGLTVVWLDTPNEMWRG